MASIFQVGQRWSSESEPELGLGTVQRASARTVTLFFSASGETREYSQENAPLIRVRFRPGDTIRTRQGKDICVDEVRERQGLLIYFGAGNEWSETELNDQVGVTSPEQRLRSGEADSTSAFDLRLAALQHQHHRRKSPVRGFVGARIELIPHQLYIAPEVAGRLIPRVLLADEVGLGKTIEACLIVSRLLQTRRVQRVLILVPEPLVHQWFVELLRRFSLWFHIFDEERCDAIETADPGANPFFDDQLVLCGISFLTRRPERVAQVTAASWDLLVVDEAHHLTWSPTAASPEYSLVESLAQRVPALLLLTATPEQLGVASHFARLRLLDPDRYYSLADFIKEEEHYREVASVADKLLRNLALETEDMALLGRVLAPPSESGNACPSNGAKIQPVFALPEDSVGRQALIGDLIDRHGTGRLMFRNTRSTIRGFPRRVACLYTLRLQSEESTFLERLATEFATDNTAGSPYDSDLTNDPRVAWLASFLRERADRKVLLICRTASKVKAIEAALQRRVRVLLAQFHEGLPLVQRDRNAAWFAEPEGAQLLLASEIGSEGRNFQFAHDLVLFDLPLNPELVEQRIGRLDRIGQSAEIQVHIPYVQGSAQEVLARWYHEGLNAFAKNLHGGHEVFERFTARVADLAQDYHETQDDVQLQRLIRETQEATKEIAARLEQGRDRLLELNSFRADLANRIIQEIRHEDDDGTLESFLLAAFDEYGIHAEELDPGTYRLGSAGVFADTFPGLPIDGITFTRDRRKALTREDVHFLTWDHPLVTGALDLIIGSTKGTASVAIWPDRSTGRAVYLEAIYILECVAPPALHADRFLPPTPIRTIVDHHGKEVQFSVSATQMARELKAAKPEALLGRSLELAELVPGLVAAAETLAHVQVAPTIQRAQQEMNRQLQHEIARLKDLQQVNPNVPEAEILELQEHQRALQICLGAARLRLDAIRWIRRGPA